MDFSAKTAVLVDNLPPISQAITVVEGIPGGGRLSAMCGLSCIDNVVLRHIETREEARDYPAYETMSVNAIVFSMCPEG